PPTTNERCGGAPTKKNIVLYFFDKEKAVIFRFFFVFRERGEQKRPRARLGVGGVFPRPIAWIIDMGGKNPPLQCWANYFFKRHKRRAKLKSRRVGRKIKGIGFVAVISGGSN